jgi:hypothetical protein
MTTRDEPLLGLATTEELIRELIARFTVPIPTLMDVERALMMAEMLGGLSPDERNYRTVGWD